MISIKGIEKHKVFAALFNGARTQGMGVLHYVPGGISETGAKAAVEGGAGYYDYVQGRVMKVDLSGDEFDPWLYDRDNGEGAAQKQIDGIT